MSPVGMTLLMLVAFAGFGYLALRKLRIVASLAPEVRWDHPGARLMAVVTNGFLQSRMIRRDWKPGLMHAVIFLGFMALLARKLQLIVIGYHEPFVYPGLAGGWFAALKDGVEIAVLIALAYAFWRRYVVRPVRLEANREALLILSLILAIMITDLLFDGFRFALLAGADPGIAHERDYAFAGRRIAEALAGLSPAALDAGYQLAYWTQLVVVFAFLVILPLGEHFHIVTALPALFFRRGSPANTVPFVDLEKMMAEDADAEAMRVGVRTAKDLTWKEGLDAFTCTECGRCKDACPTFLTGKPLSMKWVNDSLKQHLAGEARRDRRGQVPGRGAAAAGRRDHRRGHAVGVHDLRLLRSRVPDRARASAALLPDAPAPGADGRRVPARAEGRLRGLRVAEQPVGTAGGRAGRLGREPRRQRRRNAGAGARARLPLLRGLGGVVRPARAAGRPRLRRHPAAGGRAASGSSARPRRRPASASAARATRCCSSSSRRRSRRR